MLDRARWLVVLVAALPAACAVASSDTTDGLDASASSSGSDAGHDAIALGDPATHDGATASDDDAGLSGKSCATLPDGTLCGSAPDVCHDSPICAGGACAPPAAKADGFVCGAAPDACHDAPACASGVCAPPANKPDGTSCASAPDACHTDATCTGGACGAIGTRADGYEWTAGDGTARCCSGQPIHTTTNADCGACGIQCNASNGESCQAFNGVYFCRGCVASAACWSKCCSTSFSPYSCAASDCAGNCDSALCPTGAHCVNGNGVTSDYCSY